MVIGVAEVEVKTRESLRGRVVGRLREKFLGAELAKVENQPELEVLGVQQKLEELTAMEHRKDPGVEAKKEEVVRAWRETATEKERRRLMGRVFSADEAGLIVQVGGLLDREGVGEEIAEAAFAFGKERTGQLGVDGKNVEKAWDGHVREVMKVMPEGEGKGMLKLLAAVHDIAKYVHVGENDEVILGMHETASGVLTVKVVKEMLLDEGVQKTIDPAGKIKDRQEAAGAVADFCGLAVLGHGYEEFPFKNAMKSGDKLATDMHRLFKVQLYLNNYRPDGWLADAELVRWYEGLREGDMAVGMTIRSLAKYHGDALLGRVPRAATSADYVLSFGPTVLQYFIDMPEELGLRETTKSEIWRSVFLLAVVQRGKDPQFLQEVFDELGGRGWDIGRIGARVRKMKMVYPPREEEEEERRREGFAQHNDLFLKLGKMIERIPVEALKAAEAAGLFKKMRGGLNKLMMEV